jgi:protein-tyrosine phosphatase
MLSLFKSRPNTLLADIIPSGYVDIHSHLLPKIDDGAKSIDDTLYLITELKKLGFKKSITTPHVMGLVWENTSVDILSNLKSTQTIIEQNSPFTIKAAAEYMIDEQFVNLFKNDKLLTLKDNYVLIEMSYLNQPINLYEVIFDLQVAGYKPVLAHPERYNFFHHKTDEYFKLKKSGCFFQLNLLSAVGYYGENVAKCADFLLKNSLIDFVGSDVHHSKHIESFYKKIVLKNIPILKDVIQNNSFFDFD